jgi:hypothetical protein
MSEIPRSVNTPHYHVWTDALHARQLARDTKNEWDRGTYVRWAIQSAWTAFEATCEVALETSGLGMRFKDHFDAAVRTKGLAPVDWGSGLWQKVRETYQLRKDYGHLLAPQKRLFAPVDEADFAIATLREATKALYLLLSQDAPKWVDDDNAFGWEGSGGSVAHATVIKAGVDEDDPGTIRVAYVYKRREFVTDVLPPGTDPEPFTEQLIESIIIPISEVRVYRGTDLVDSIQVDMRGS